MRDNVKVCKGECGCKEWPRGGSLTIFGENFDSVCSSYFIFITPDDAALENIKKLTDLTKAAADRYYERKLKWRAERAGTVKIGTEDTDAMFPRDKEVNIELSEMEIKNWAKAEFADGLMTLTNTGSNRGRAHTRQKFDAPVKIDLRVKVGHAHLEIMFGGGSLKFHREEGGNELRIYDIGDGDVLACADKAYLPEDEFVDIEWVSAKDFTAVRVNGELRHFSDTDDYIYSWLTDSDFNISSHISVCCYRDSTVTVESLRVTPSCALIRSIAPNVS
jgi:hypothetical protein